MTFANACCAEVKSFWAVVSSSAAITFTATIA